MSDERLRILHLLSEGKLPPEEAEKLLRAMESGTQQIENPRKPTWRCQRKIPVCTDGSEGREIL
ncbi:MAG: hypothetical protein WBI82_15295 [Sphaerochaeta sp.]